MANCPHCRAQVIDNGTLAGKIVSCAACGGKFQMPAAPPPFQPIQVQPIVTTGPRTAPARAKRKRHWAKTAMLVATICWPVLALLLGFASSVSRSADFRLLGNDYYLGPGRVGYWGAERSAAIGASFVFTAMLVTMLYGLAMFVLFVLWFATKDDR